MHWKLKGLLQGGLARIPLGSLLNDQLQLLFGERGRFAAHIDSKVLHDWSVHAAHLRAHGKPLRGLVLLELGTGWLPVLPLCFFLAGSAQCSSFDLHRKMALRSLSPLLRRLERHLPSIADAAGLELAEVTARYRALLDAGTPEQMLRRAGIEYHAPADAARTGLADGSIDVFFSNSVLEHVGESALDGLMREAARVLRTDGLVSHSVNCGDHYAYFDRSITQLNYLKFSAAQWRVWNNSILYQNRLRPCDFVASAERNGLRVIARHWHPDQSLLSELPAWAVAAEFRGYPAEELSATSVDIIARPA
ncbi:MAG: class I SAM-dependent methyltransferase [Burkholderiales bacterium]